jgi:hypothetical protein
MLAFGVDRVGVAVMQVPGQILRALAAAAGFSGDGGPVSLVPAVVVLVGSRGLVVFLMAVLHGNQLRPPLAMVGFGLWSINRAFADRLIADSTTNIPPGGILYKTHPWRGRRGAREPQYVERVKSAMERP